MKAQFVFSLLALALPVGLFAQAAPAVSDSFQVNYASNLNVGDSALNFTNTGASGGSLCLNVYVFSPDEEEQSCCNCTLSPNSLWSAALLQGLLTNTLTLGNNYLAHFHSAVVKVIATNPASGCNAATVTAANLAPGLVGWGTHYHVTATGAGAITETSFVNAALSTFELNRATSFCSFAQANGSGAGICSGCTLGGLAQPVAALSTKLGTTQKGS